MGPGSVELRGLRHLSSDPLPNPPLAVPRCHQVTNSTGQAPLYEICDANYKELIAHYEKVGNEYRDTHNMEDPIGGDILTELNRLLMNYLSSFRTMIDHYETHYKRLDRQGSHWLKSFKSYTATIYESSFTYRFFLGCETTFNIVAYR